MLCKQGGINFAFNKIIFNKKTVMPRPIGYGDATATYIRRSKIPSHIYVKHQYMQE